MTPPRLLVLGLAAACVWPMPGGAQARPRAASAAALAELERRAATDSNDAVVHLELGQAYRDGDRLAAADSAFRRAIALAPQYAEAHLASAELHDLRDGRYWKEREKAEGAGAVRAAWEEHDRLYRRAFLLDPLVDLRHLARLDEVTTVPINGKRYLVPGAFTLAKGVNAMRAGRYEDAIKRFGTMIAEGGPDGRWAPDYAWYYRGLAAAHLKRYDAAVADFWALVQRSAAREAKDDTPNPIPMRTNEYRYLLGTMLALNGQVGEAIPVFRRVLEFDVGLYMANVQLARLYERAGRWDDAVEARRGAINANPDDASLLVDLGGTLLQAGRLAEADSVLRDAAAARPRDARPLYLLGLAAGQRGDTAGAREAFRRFLLVAPSRYQAQIEEARRLAGVETPATPVAR